MRVISFTNCILLLACCKLGEQDINVRQIEHKKILLRGEKLTGCMCPDTVPKDTLRCFCGKDLKPKPGNETNKCMPQSKYRCVDPNVEAFHYMRCVGKAACIPSTCK